MKGSSLLCCVAVSLLVGACGGTSDPSPTRVQEDIQGSNAGQTSDGTPVLWGCGKDADRDHAYICQAKVGEDGDGHAVAIFNFRIALDGDGCYAARLGPLQSAPVSIANVGMSDYYQGCLAK